MASKLLSLKGMFSLSAWTISIRSSRPSEVIFFLPTDNIPSEMSSPISWVASVFFARLMIRSPVPVAMSKMLSGFVSAIICTTFLRHFTSIPKEITRFKPSYSPEILSNICSTCCFLDCSEVL